MPSLISIEAEAVGPVARSTSDRDITIFTGRPVFRDSAKATGSMVTEKRYGAGGNASAHSGGIMSAKKVRLVKRENEGC